MQLQHVSRSILDQLISISEQLNDEEFRAPLKILSSNSIDKHMRHIIEFYDLMVIGYQTGIVNYDSRSHDCVIEENRLMAIEKMNALKSEIKINSNDHDLILKASYDKEHHAPITIKTSFFRELQYNIEHAIHHMAIIKIALVSEFELVSIHKGFGIAYSTIQYEKEKNVHGNFSS